MVSCTIQNSTLGLNLEDADGTTPMILAANQGHVDMLVMLLNHGSDPNFVARNGLTALNFAADAGFGTIIQILLENGANLTVGRIFLKMFSKISQKKAAQQSGRPESGIHEKGSMADSNSLVKATLEGDIEGAKQRIEEGGDMEAATEDGCTTLMVAGSRGCKAVLNLLISMGANIDATNNKGWTTLINSIKGADLATIELLLSHRADVNHLSLDHWTVLAKAT